jgi:nucleoside-diphosphate-sugar epimerase
MRHLLVTGAAGFIGRQVVAAAVRRGWLVLAMDRRPGAAMAQVTWLQHQACATAPLPELPAVPDAAILLAWPIVPGSYLESADNTEALTSTIATAQHLLGLGCRRLVGVGTCAEYAPTQGCPIREDHPLAPDTLYAACKISAHLVLAQLCRQAKAELAWSRIFNPYGPGEPATRLLPSIARQAALGQTFAAGSGSQVRDYVHVEDVGSALALLADAGPCGPVNICTGVPISLAQIMQTVAEACGGGPESIALGAKADRAWDPPYLVGDASRLVAAGWRPRLPQDGLAAYGRQLRGRV